MLKSIYRSRSGQGDDWGRRQQLWNSQSFHLYYTIRETELRDGAKKPLCKLEMVYVQWRSFTSNQVDCLLALNNWWHCSSFPSIRWLHSRSRVIKWHLLHLTLCKQRDISPRGLHGLFYRWHKACSVLTSQDSNSGCNCHLADFSAIKKNHWR